MTTINTANDHTRPPILIASPFPKLSIFFKHKVTHGDWSTLISNFFKTVKSNSFSLPEKLGRGPTKSKIVSIAGLLSNKFLFLKWNCPRDGGLRGLSDGRNFFLRKKKFEWPVTNETRQMGSDSSAAHNPPSSQISMPLVANRHRWHSSDYRSIEMNMAPSKVISAFFFFFTITDDISLGIEHETKEGRRVSNAFLKAAKIHEILHCPRPLDKSKYLLKNAIKILDFFLKTPIQSPRQIKLERKKQRQQNGTGRSRGTNFPYWKYFVFLFYFK